ncbi:winged helix DNA-binding domain-containing protein [Glycomyces paridis]|uniref:Winged helix DNA-binding domain-containing protein n=1 Tax=Glycomyces paridis TaxID=2126555 RepID=A0A4S8PKG7_9ACTN|nr:winged helix DNA-binding domain-containing protein [Glycomyces paridis]THV30062.1 winged helix DNA-binding domain-containing protein [Glycomyces paridis]
MSTPTDLTPRAIAAWRAHSQRLWGERLAAPMDAFEHLGAVQSQEYQPSKLTPAMRAVPDAQALAFAGPAAVDALIDSGAVVRTHVLRPTWHTVPAGDLRMMLAASAERVEQLMAGNDRAFGFDEWTIGRSVDVLADATAGARHLTREEASAVLAEAGISDPTGQRLGHMLAHAELREAICSGTPKGGKQTYANFDERVPAGRISRGEAVRELARRFFVSRGPATVKDFTRWATLKVVDAKAAIEELGLASVEAAGRVLYFGGERPEAAAGGPVVDFVQGFDEMLCSYTDSKDLVLHHSVPRSRFPDRPRFNPAILLDGQVIGNWKATPKRESLVVETWRARGFTAAEIAALRRGADRLRAWYGKDELDLRLDHAA